MNESTVLSCLYDDPQQICTISGYCTNCHVAALFLQEPGNNRVLLPSCAISCISIDSCNAAIHNCLGRDCTQDSAAFSVQACESLKLK